MGENGFIKKRRAILDHLISGRFTALEYAAYDVMIALADKATGVWWGSAKSLATQFGAGDLGDRQGRHILESLETKGYIKRFPTPRAHGNYPILINKYEVTYGAQRGMRLNALSTMNWRKPVFEVCLEHGAEHGAEHAPSLEVEVEVEVKKEKKEAAQPAATVSSAPLPDWIPINTWAAYREMRIRIRRPLTGHGVDLAIRKLAELRAQGHPAEQVLEQSIFNSWQGLFPLEGDRANGRRKGKLSDTEIFDQTLNDLGARRTHS